MFDTNFWQATTIVPANICFYEANVKAGVVYKIKNFLVIEYKASSMVTSQRFLIQFTQ